MIGLSFLDQSPAVRGVPHDAVIREAVAFARSCERMGFRRYWLAEHHNGAANIGSAPEILVAAIAARTRTIRVGSAGVLLSHYAPLKVAEQFRVLEALAPGRID
ncbi:MAG: LLM class flavin-dependent oxidoreductase, partial [Sphingobium sp.]